MEQSRSKLPPKLSPEELNRPVRRRQVGPPVGPQPPQRPQAQPEPEPQGFKSDPAWDKLLLVVGAALVVLAVFVVPGLLTGGGGDNPVAQAAEATMQYPGVRMTLTGSGGGAGAGISFQGGGVINGDTNRAQFEMTMTGQGISGSAQRLTIGEVVDGADLYMRMPELTQMIGAGKPWVLIRGQAFGDLLNQSGGLGPGGGSNPQAQLDMLKSATKDVTSVGREPIDGVITTHYTAAIDVQKLLDQLRNQLPDQLANAVQNSIDPSQLQETVDVWIDDQGLIRRMTANATLAKLVNLTMTMSFTDYGIHPQINVPPPSEVQDITPLLQQGTSQLFQ